MPTHFSAGARFGVEDQFGVGPAGGTAIPITDTVGAGPGDGGDEDVGEVLGAGAMVVGPGVMADRGATEGRGVEWDFPRDPS